MRTAFSALVLLTLVAAAFLWEHRAASKQVVDSLRPAASPIPAGEAGDARPGLLSTTSARRQVVLEQEDSGDSNDGTTDGLARQELVLRVVSDVTGLPIEDAQVAGEWGTRTDAHGVVRAWIDQGRNLLPRWAHVSAEGFVGRLIMVPPGNLEWEARLMPGVPFELRVTDGFSGSPIEGATIWARQWDDQESEVKSSSHVTTGPEGTARVPPVHQDLPVEVKVEAAGYLARDVSLNIEWPGRHDIELGIDGRIRGRLLGREGEPVSGAAVSLDGLRLTRPEFGVRVWTDEVGHFSLAGLRLGVTYILNCKAPTASYGPFSLTAAEPECWVEMRSDSSPASLRVRVEDESGTPWAEKWVDVNRWVSEEHASWPESMRDDHIGQGRTDENGLAEVDLGAHGAFEVLVENRGGALVTHRGSVDPMGVGHVRVVLPRGLVLRGRVVDEESRPLPDLDVRFRRAAALTDADGAFEIQGLSPESGDLIVSQSGSISSTMPARITWLLYRDVAPGGDRQELQRPALVSILGRFVRDSGLARANWTVALEGRGSMTLSSVLEEDRSSRIDVAISGVKWGLSVGTQGAGASFDVFPSLDPSPGTQVNLGELGLRSDRTVSGRVWMPDQTPAVAAKVDLWLDDFHFTRETVTDYQGYFLVDNVPAGNGWFKAFAEDGYESQPLPFKGGVVAVAGELQLEQEPLLHGHLRRADGSVVQYETVWLYTVGPDGRLASGSGTRMQENGFYEIRNAPGSYQMIVTPLGPGEPVLGPVVELVRGVDLEMDVVLP